MTNSPFSIPRSLRSFLNDMCRTSVNEALVKRRTYKDMIFRGIKPTKYTCTCGSDIKALYLLGEARKSLPPGFRIRSISSSAPLWSERCSIMSMPVTKSNVESLKGMFAALPRTSETFERFRSKSSFFHITQYRRAYSNPTTR